jgi:DNA-binding NarL/FixJ family response regulator
MSEALRILIVDDNPQDRKLVIRQLRMDNPDAKILEAIDQRQFDECLQQAKFDIVVTDFHLQWTDGIRVLQAVKRRLPNCPVIMFTATGNEEIAVEAMKQGLDDYIIKNVKHLVRLRGAVQAVLTNARTRRRMDQLASRLESILLQLHVGVFSCSPEGRLLELNDVMAELLSMDAAADASETGLETLFPTPPEAAAFLRDVVTSNVPRETEIEVVTSSAQKKVYRLHARLLRNDVDPLRIDGLLEDVTGRKQSEADAKKTAVAIAQIAMLSPREHDVLQEVVAGSANKVIARRLGISEKTVEKHRSNLMKKLRVRSVAELVRLAMLAEASSA